MQDFSSHYSDSVDYNECKNTLEKTHIEENADELFDEKNDSYDTQQLQQDIDQDCSKECELISENSHINEFQTQTNEQNKFHTIIDEKNEIQMKNSEQQKIQTQINKKNEIQTHIDENQDIQTQIDEQQEIQTRIDEQNEIQTQIDEQNEIRKVEQQEIQTQIDKQNDEQVDESSSVQSNFTFKDQIIQYLKKENKMELIELIGTSSFGTSILVEETTTKEKYIMKISHITNFTQFSPSDDHDFTFTIPAIMKNNEYKISEFCNKDHLIIRRKYIQKGSLNDMIFNEQNKSLLIDPLKYIIILGIALGMEFLHSHKIIHGNLKPENILIDEFLHPQICDFGIFEFNDQKDFLMNSNDYIAPEIFKGNKQDFKSDVYSYSMIIYSLITGQKPKIELSNISNTPIKRLLKMCWKENPEKRPSFHEILEKLIDPNLYSSFNINSKFIYYYLKEFPEEMFHSLPTFEKFIESNNEIVVSCVGNFAVGRTALLKTYATGIKCINTRPTNSIGLMNRNYKTKIGKISLSIYDLVNILVLPQTADSYLQKSASVIFFTDVNTKDEYLKFPEIFKNSFHFS